jgi:hypothetical protein
MIPCQSVLLAVLAFGVGPASHTNDVTKVTKDDLQNLCCKLRLLQSSGE